MRPNPIADASPGFTPSGAAPPRPSKIEDAARQFESLIIAQMLRTARESGTGGGFGDEEDSSSTTMLEVSEQQFSQLLANNGGLGLAKMVVSGLQREEDVNRQPPFISTAGH